MTQLHDLLHEKRPNQNALINAEKSNDAAA